MTFEEFVEEKNLTPENTPGSEHALLLEAYREGYIEGTVEIKKKMTDERLKYLKNKISLELKDVSTQQGFEIICKRLDASEKENAELKQQIEELKTHCRAVDDVNVKRL